MPNIRENILSPGGKKFHHLLSKENMNHQHHLDHNQPLAINDYELICFSPLPWNSYFKRPHKISLKLSGYYKVLFVEFHRKESGPNSFTIEHIQPNLDVFIAEMRTENEFNSLIEEIIGSKNKKIIGWFCSHTFHFVLGHLNFNKIIYDCIDDICPLGADSLPLIKQEKSLLQHASVVITSTRSVFESKMQQHANVFYIPNFIDINHYTVEPNESLVKLDEIQKPIIGYTGVVDDRIDFNLLYKTATAMPHCSFVLVGPIANVVVSDISGAPENIHFMGQQSSSSLSHFIQKFSICMVPFTTSEKTKHSCPSKILEYMAAQKHILCTRLVGSIREFPLSVHYVASEKEFANEINRLLDKSINPNLKLYDYHLRNRSWEKTLSRIKIAIQN